MSYSVPWSPRWRRIDPCRPSNRDHALLGEWKDCRDCHLRPDLVLMYQKPDAHTLQLVRLGSHAELFG